MRRVLPALVLVACTGRGEPKKEPRPTTPTGTEVPSTTPGTPGGTVGTTDELPAADRPDDPTFPSTIDHLSIALRTGDGSFDGTNSNTLSVCLTDTDCFRLNVADVDDFRVGEFDVYHFDGVGLPRSAVDRVEIRSANGSDMFRPGCLELRFDGEPVYCREAPGDGLGFGDASGELTSWIDPDGLHNDCTTCYPETLTHGPMVGAVTTDTVRVWVRTDATRTVGLRMSRSPQLGSAPVVAWAQPSPHDDYTATLTVPDVPGGTWYYGIEVDDEPLATSQLTMAPTDPGTRRIAMGSCSKDDPQSLYARVDAMDPDLFLMLGDNHYANSSDLDSLRWYYRWSLERPERKALLDHTPIGATWDDHDYVGNNTDGTEPGRDTAVRAFAEYWANPSVGLPATPGVFTRWRWGDLEFFFVDDRYYRGLDNQMLGDEQTAWLVDAVAGSDATFKILACGSRWTEEGSSDSWAAFLPARDALFQELADRNVEGLVLVSGDVHRSELRWIARTGAYDLPELTSSPMAHSNSPCRNDSALHCFDNGNSFVTVDFDTAAADPSFTATIWDATGTNRGDLTVRLSELR